LDWLDLTGRLAVVGVVMGMVGASEGAWGHCCWWGVAVSL